MRYVLNPLFLFVLFMTFEAPVRLAMLKQLLAELSTQVIEARESTLQIIQGAFAEFWEYKTKRSCVYFSCLFRMLGTSVSVLF
jgi:hypothetical protein